MFRVMYFVSSTSLNMPLLSNVPSMTYAHTPTKIKLYTRIGEDERKQAMWVMYIEPVVY